MTPADRIAELEAEVAELTEQRDGLNRAHDLMLHKLITCGVAATRPDLSRRARDYGGKWDSPQAESVRKVVDDLAAAREEAERLRELVREADDALIWASTRSPEAAATMVKEAKAWQVKARAALKGKP